MTKREVLCESAAASEDGNRELGCVLGRVVRVLLALAFCQAQLAVGSERHWLATWGCAPQLTEPRNLPPVALSNRTLRQFVHVSAGGERLRVRFSNAYGTNLVTINSVHVALSKEGAPGDIDAASDRPLTFTGAASVHIAPGTVAWSDSVEFALPPLANVAVSTFFGEISATTITGHPGSRTTSFIVAGDAVAAPSLPTAVTVAHWYVLTGIDVFVEGPGHAVVILGDSLSDGRGSTTDGNNRWPDDLAGRLQSNAPQAGIAVVNMGIGGNGLFSGLGPAATARFDRDVLDQSGVRQLIVFEGVNDIGGASASASPALASRLIEAYAQFAVKAHARHILAYGATITPFGGSFYYSAAHEASRQRVNDWIRTNTLYDGVLDFDAVARDRKAPANLLPAYNSGDGLHLNPAGYRALAAAVDLTLFRQ